MDIKAYINTIVKSSFVEIEDILCRINKDMQCSYKGNLLIRKQQVLLNDIKQMYEIIYRPALDMGLHVLEDNYDSNTPMVYVENACNNLIRAYEYFKNPPIIKIDATIQTNERITQHNDSYTPPITDWLTLDEVCKEFRLSKNNVKSREWRNKNNFPYHQDGGAYSSVQYNRAEITEWMKKNKKC